MTINRTTLLDLPLPVTGTESGTWGDTTNNGLTQYMDIAIAGMSNLTSANFTAGAVTIETTEGTSSATNIVATSAQYAGFRVTSLAQNSTITVGNTGTSPARSYRLINADATYSLTFKATGQTGVTLLPGQSAVVAFNGTDYVIVGMVGAGTATDNAVVRFDGTTGKLVQNSVVTIADSTGDVAGVGALTMGGNLTLNGGTANGVLYLNGSKVATSGSALTFDGTTFVSANTQTGLHSMRVYNGSNASAGDGAGIQFGVNGSNIYGRLWTDNNSAAMYFDNLLATPFIWRTSGTSEQMRLTSTGLGIGTSSPGVKLDIFEQRPNDNTRSTFRISVESAPGNQYAARIAAAKAVGGQPYMLVMGPADNNGHLAFTTGASDTERMRLDSSGNLGLGVTPSAWNTGGNLQLPSGGNIGTAGNGLAVVSNSYYNGSNSIYITSNPATAYTSGSGAHAWYTAPSGTAGNAITFTQAMTLDASGRLLIGGTTAANTILRADRSNSSVGDATVNSVGYFVNTYDNNTNGSTAYPVLSLERSGASGISNGSLFEIGLSRYSTASTDAYTQANFIVRDGNSSSRTTIATFSNNLISFSTGSTERARITSGGYFKASNSGTYVGSTASYHELVNNDASNGVAVIESTSASYISYVLTPVAARNTTDNTFYAIGYYNRGAGAYKFLVADSGNVTNTNGTYGTISDAKMKTDIVDAGSQWADIKAIRFRKFKMKNDPSGLLQLGVVAQELEQTSPGLVDEHVDRDAEGNDLGTTTKSVKTSILLMKAAKALQEAMARIETLEAKVSALEGN